MVNVKFFPAELLISKSIASIASNINGFSLAAVPAGMMNGWVASLNASIFNEAAFTAPNKALVFREAGLSIANINAIIIHANITDDNAQQILSEITKANRDLTSAANVYELLDDWNDNKLTGRDGAGMASTGFTNLFAHKDKFRPEWTTIGGSPTAVGGKLKLDASGEAVATASTFAVGTWEWSFTKVSGTVYGVMMGISQETTGLSQNLISSNCYEIFVNNSSNNLLLREGTADASVSLITTTWSNDANPHIFKMTRDGSSGFELFEDGASKGTVTDSTKTSFSYIMMAQCVDSDGDCDIDNLKVY